MNSSFCSTFSLSRSRREGPSHSSLLPLARLAQTARLDGSVNSCFYDTGPSDPAHPSRAPMPSPAFSSAGGLLHPTFSSAPFFFDRAALSSDAGKGGVVAEYTGGGAAGGNGDTSGSFLEGESWRGGFTGGSAVGVRLASPIPLRQLSKRADLSFAPAAPLGAEGVVLFLARCRRVPFWRESRILRRL